MELLIFGEARLCDFFTFLCWGSVLALAHLGLSRLDVLKHLYSFSGSTHNIRVKLVVARLWV